MATIYTTKQNDRLDRICYDFYGSTANRQVETVIDQNPGLEEQPILLPANLSISLPDLVVTPQAPTVTQIKLWQ